MKYRPSSIRLYDQRNAVLRLIRKTKGFLLVPVAWNDPTGEKRRVAVRSALGRNARVIMVRPTEDAAFWREKQQHQGSLFFMYDEAKYFVSSNGAALFDADSLSMRLPQLKDSLAALDRVRASTGLRLPAWIFISPTTIMTEEAARSDVARADAVLARADEVRDRDANRNAAFYEMARFTRRTEPVVVSQDIREFGLDPQTAARAALGEELKKDFQALLLQDADKKRSRHELVESLPGKAVSEAQALVESLGMHLRVLEVVNGRTERTLEGDMDRCNVTVVDGKIDQADIG